MKKRAQEGNISDSLSIDRCGLPCIPSTKGRENILLLSLQHNLIAKMDSLAHLTHLLVLNLYDNKIEKIGGLESLSNLRVLMLGKNRLRSINGLDNLYNLDVLDLHGNQIQCVGNLRKLRSLRVLNLAANCLSNVDGLQDLESLQELNLKRNQVEDVSGFQNLPKLQKLYLSNNCLQMLKDLQGVLKLNSLEELSLDGNTVTLDPSYVRTVVGSFSSLKILDGNVLDELVRREAAAWTKLQKVKEDKAQASVWRFTEIEPIQNARKQWEEMQLHRFKVAEKEKQIAIVRPMTRCQALDTGSLVSITRSSPANPTSGGHLRARQRKRMSHTARPKSKTISSVPLFSTRSQIIQQIYRGTNYIPSKDEDTARPIVKRLPKNQYVFSGLEEASQSKLAPRSDFPTLIREKVVSCDHSDLEESPKAIPITGKPKRNKNPRKTSLRTSYKDEGKDFVIKIEESSMEVYGVSAVKKLIEKPLPADFCKSVTNVLFNLVIFDMLPPVFRKMQIILPNAVTFVMKETNISNLGQINMFGMLEKIHCLDIKSEGNGITRKKNWKSFVIYRLNHLGLREINGKEISSNDIEKANVEFGSLDNLIDILLPSTGKKILTRYPSLESIGDLFDSISNEDDDLPCKGIIRQNLKYMPAVKTDEARQESSKAICQLITNGLRMEENITKFEGSWDLILEGLIKYSVKDMINMNKYKSSCLQKLKDEIQIK
ncbi:leucine-rich repeat-containing protein 49-like [Artemia franciscana]|uniref:leucine-rich repeat-containing protein 49-like n=1 Tax=Artemia franciscana TaxID=6661 RepID=UPI0032DA9CF2